MNVLDLIEVAEKLGPPPLPEEIAGYEDEQDPEVRAGWGIDNPRSADWAMQRAAECEAEAQEIEAQFQAALDRLTARRDHLIERARRGAAFFTYKLAEWAGKNRTSLLKGKAKSVQMMHGTIGWRKKGGNLRVDDKAALEAWLAAQPVESGLYRMKLEPEMKEIQSLYRTTGTVPPGCTFVPEFDDLYVKADAPETALAKKGE